LPPRCCAAEDQGVEFTHEERRAALQQLQHEIFGAEPAPASPAAAARAEAAAGSGDSDSNSDEGEQQGEEGEEEGEEEGGEWEEEADEEGSAAARLAEVAQQMTWRERDRLGYDAAAADSGRWGRVIRPPRRRGRHVILDVCAAAAAAGAGAGGEGGQLERHVVAKSDTRKGVGPAGYRIAQKAGWGDLWPAPYMADTCKEVLGRGSRREHEE
jgi:hypothetical protein